MIYEGYVTAQALIQDFEVALDVGDLVVENTVEEARLNMVEGRILEERAKEVRANSLIVHLPGDTMTIHQGFTNPQDIGGSVTAGAIIEDPTTGDRLTVYATTGNRTAPGVRQRGKDLGYVRLHPTLGEHFPSLHAEELILDVLRFGGRNGQYKGWNLIALYSTKPFCDSDCSTTKEKNKRFCLWKLRQYSPGVILYGPH